MKCIHCQKELPDQAMFCTGCGKKIPRCPTCGTLLTGRVRFCPKDGTPIPQEIQELIPMAPPAAPAAAKSFCTRCGKPTEPGQKVCAACQSKAAKPAKPVTTAAKKEAAGGKKRLWLILIPVILVILLGLGALGYFAVTNDWLDFSWLDDLGISFFQGDNRDEEEDYRDNEEDEEEEEAEEEDAHRKDEAVAETAVPTEPEDEEAPAEAVPATEAPAEEAPAPAPEETPATEVPAEPEADAEVSKADPVYLNELAIHSTNGKVWTRSNEPATAKVHTNSDAPNCWKDTDIPGHTYGTVRDNCGNEYTYGIHVDGAESNLRTITYNLKGKYTRFSGYCACPEKAAAISSYVYNSSTRYSKYFEIYGDGKLLFTSASMRYDKKPQNFVVDVTGVQELTILYPATKGPNEIATLYDGLLE